MNDLSYMSIGAATPFWTRVSHERLKISHEVLSGTYKKQCPPVVNRDPVTGNPIKTLEGVYVTSLENWEKRTTAGAVFVVTLDIAAQRIVEGTHRLSTDSEIQESIDQGNQRRELMESADAALNKTRTVKIQVPK
jgi:hypothetical protein